MNRRLLWLVALLAWLPLPACGYLQAAGAIWYIDDQKDDDDDPVAGTTGGTGTLNNPPSANATSPSGNQSNAVILSYLLIDAESDSADIVVEFNFNSSGWMPASEVVGPPSEGSAGLTATASGSPHLFVWNSFADVGGQNGVAELRVSVAPAGSPVALGGAGSSATGTFGILNRLIATAAGGSTGVLNFPGGIAQDGSGNLFVADSFNHRLQVLNTQATSITVGGTTIGANSLGVVAGTGIAGFNGDNQLASGAQLNFPSGVTVDGSGNVFFADTFNHRVRRIDAVTGFITTVAGTGTAGTTGDNGLATNGQLDGPRGIALDGSGNLFIADTNSHTLRVVNTQATTQTFPPTGGVTVAPNFVRTFAGTAATPGATGDGAAAGFATLNAPWAIAFGGNGHLYIADSQNHALRVINFGAVSAAIVGATIAAGDIDTVAGTIGQSGKSGDGGPPAGSARLASPRGFALDGSDNIYIADTGNSRLRVVNDQPGAITLAGVTIASGRIDAIAGGTASPGPNDGDGAASSSSRLAGPEAVTVLTNGHAAIADTGNSRIRVTNVGLGSITVAGTVIAASNIDTVAGAVGGSVPLLRPDGMVRLGSILFIADRDGHRVYQLDLTTTLVTVVAGNGDKGFAGDNGAAANAELDSPRGLALDGAGNLYIADWGNGRVRVVNRQGTTQTILNRSVPAGAIRTVAGGGGGGDGGNAFNADITDAPGIDIDGSSQLLIAHAAGNRIRVVSTGGTINTLAGNATGGFVDGTAAAAARFNGPQGVWIDSAGNLVVTDTGNHAVRYVNLGAGSASVCGVAVAAGDVETIAGDPPAGGPQQGFNGDNQSSLATLLDTPVAAIRDGNGALILIDGGNQRIRRCHQTTGVVTTLAGTGVAGFNGDGIPPANALINSAGALLMDGASPSNLFFSDGVNRRVRRFTP